MATLQHYPVRQSAWSKKYLEDQQILSKWAGNAMLEHFPIGKNYNLVLYAGNPPYVGLYHDEVDPNIPDEQFKSFKPPVGEAISIRKVTPHLVDWVGKQGRISISSASDSRFAEWLRIVPRLLKGSGIWATSLPGELLLSRKAVNSESTQL